MTQRDLLDDLRMQNTHLSLKQLRQAVHVIFGQIKMGLIQGRSLNIPRFGRFALRQRAARLCRNPKTGICFEQEAHQVLQFKAAKTFRDQVNHSE